MTQLTLEQWLAVGQHLGYYNPDIGLYNFTGMERAPIKVLHDLRCLYAELAEAGIRTERLVAGQHKFHSINVSFLRALATYAARGRIIGARPQSGS